MRSRRVLPVLAVLLLALVGTALAPVERPFAIKGDEATYVAMALSIAYDHDLRYSAVDLHRFQRTFGTGPVGIFLQRPGPDRVSFAKPFVYPVVAAPFVRFGGLRGLLFLNLLLLGAILWMAWMFAATRVSALSAAVLAVAFVFASILGLYSVWRTPEVFNTALVFASYFLWLYKEVAPDAVMARHRWLAHPATDYLAAACLGLATYSKPPNALLVVPLVLWLFARKRWLPAAAVGLAFLLCSAGGFGMNRIVSGEWNYQGGGDRRTFNDNFPYSDPSTSFETGWPMLTENSDAESLLAPAVFLPLFEHNTVYFFVGRDAGLVPYFFPGVVILIAWLARPRAWTKWQMAIAATLAASVVVLLALAPYTWNGGGGPPGNRYFLTLYPVLFFLIPPSMPAWTAAASLLGLVVTAPLLVSPLAASYGPWANVERGVPRLLPIELTLVDDLPARLNPERRRLDLDGGLLYLMDGNAFMPEEEKRFWVAGAARAEMILRTDRAIARATLHLHSNVANHVTVALGGAHAAIDLAADDNGTVVLEPGPGVAYASGVVYVFTVTTTGGFVPAVVDPASKDRRFLGVFIEPKFTLVQ